MNIEKYDWLNDIYNQINFNNLPHGIIINGPSGIGKKILAKEISQKIIANFNEGLDPQNQSLFNSDHHPDFYLLDRDKIYLKDIIKQKQESKYWDEEKGYKDIRSQLDLLWHDIDTGKFGDTAKTGEWYKDVKAVKDRFTKTDYPIREDTGE